jgi:hypothetical protein
MLGGSNHEKATAFVPMGEHHNIQEIQRSKRPEITIPDDWIAMLALLFWDFRIV